MTVHSLVKWSLACIFFSSFDRGVAVLFVLLSNVECIADAKGRAGVFVFGQAGEFAFEGAFYG